LHARNIDDASSIITQYRIGQPVACIVLQPLLKTGQTMTKHYIAIMLLAVVACGKKQERAATGSASANTGSAVVANGVTEPIAKTATLSPKIKAARCGEPCLFLTDTPLDKLQDVYRAECAGMETKDLGFSDCKQMDYVRNCVYAAHGLVYKKKRWKTRFEAKPWYEANPAVEAKTALGSVELANIHELHQRAKACKHGMQISGADFEKIKALFASLDKTPDSVAMLFQGEKTTAADFGKQLREELTLKDTTKRIDLTKLDLVNADYVKDINDDLVQEQVGAAADIIKATPKARTVVINADSGFVGDEENPISEGTYIVVVFDATDNIVAVGAQHYLYD
jgi:hypothetical protein